MGADTIVAHGCQHYTGGRTNCVDLGIEAVGSATKWVCHIIDSTSETRIVSAVNIDTAWHNMVAWCDGSNTYFSVDGETPVALGRVTNFAVAQSPVLHYITGAGGTLTHRIDAYLHASERSA